MVKRQLLIRGLLVASIVAAMVLVYGRSALAGIQRWGLHENNDTVSVVVADRYLSAFHIIRPQAVHVRQYPRAYVPVGAIQDVSELTRENGMPAYTTIVGIPQGQVLTRMILAEAGREQGLSSLLRPGKAAVSFSIEKSRAAGGWIQPGDTIAIFETRAVGPERPSRLLFESVQVLAVNGQHIGQKAKTTPTPSEKSFIEMARGEQGDQTLTVLLNTRESNLLVEAQERGELSVVLRPTGDDLPWLEK